MLNKKLKLLFLMSMLLFVFFVSCSNQEVSKFEEKEETLSINWEDSEFSSSELDLYEASGLDKDTYDILILDSDKDRILFVATTDRYEGQKPPEGIMSKTEQMYSYNLTDKKVESIAKFNDFYVIGGHVSGDKYAVIGIHLSVLDDKYSVLFGEKNELKEIFSGSIKQHFTLWPDLFKLDSDIFLFEPQIENDGNITTSKNAKLYKLSNTKVEEIKMNIPVQFRILDGSCRVSKDSFVTFWENTDEKKAYFIVLDSNFDVKIIPFPKKYRLIDFGLNGNVLFVSAQSETDYPYVLVYDIDKYKLYTHPFGDNLYIGSIGKNTTNDNKLIASDTKGNSFLSFKSGELTVERIKVFLDGQDISNRGSALATICDSGIILYHNQKQFVFLKKM